ncbi:MAG TPA: FG-GAP repeat protein, partial [bacterium]
MNESRLHRLTRGFLPVILLLCVAFPWLAGCMPGVANEVLGEAPILGEFLSTAANGSAAASDTFGISAAVDGDYALAGAPSQTIAGVQAGGAYVYRWSGSAWGEEFQLSIPAGDGPAAGDDFGRSVGISGDYLIVGATNQAGGTGAAYIFQRTGQNTWGNPWRVQDAPSTGLGYGQTVAISGDHAIVAATGAN